jgi:protein-tyrosine phosphatase
MDASFVDIHCHMLPEIDDGATDWDESLAMARLAVNDGIATVIVTPHQLGNFRCNQAAEIRRRTADLQSRLHAAGVPISVLPGADVRIDADLVEQLACGEVLTLGDHRRHVLIELPHELYLPLEPLLARLAPLNIMAILSHPERNEGVLRKPAVLAPIVEGGCLLQVTAGSLCGTFGPRCQQLAEWLIGQGLVHFIATDAHGSRSRRPLMRRAFERVVELTDAQTAIELCSTNPELVANGRSVASQRRDVPRRRTGWWRGKPAA